MAAICYLIRVASLGLFFGLYLNIASLRRFMDLVLFPVSRPLACNALITRNLSSRHSCAVVSKNPVQMLCGVLIVIAAMESNSGITGVHVETSRMLQDEKLEFRERSPHWHRLRQLPFLKSDRLQTKPISKRKLVDILEQRLFIFLFI